MGEWRTGTLSEIAETVMGQSPDGESSNTARLGLPLLNGPTEFGTRSPVPVQYTTDPRRTCEIGDILFCVRGSTTGRMNWADQVYAIGRGIAALRHKSGTEFQYYLRAVLDYNLPTLLQAATGSTFPNVSFSDLDELEIEFPLEHEQRAIASVLSSLDDKIDLLHRQNITLEAMAETLWRQWFVEEAEGGWQTKRLDELCTITRGASPRPIIEYVVNGSVPWIKIADATGSSTFFIDRTHEFITEDGARKSIRVSPGDLILSNSATCGIPYFVELEGCIHDGWLLFRETRSISKLFLFFFLKHINRELNQVADGSVQNNLNTTILKEYELSVPPRDLVDRFDREAGIIVDKIRRNIKQLRTLERTRDSLLPKLLSGEVRVRN